jgi:hypothetical protein
VAYCHQMTPETMETLLANLGCVAQEPIMLALQKQSVKRNNGTLRTYVTAKTPAYQKGLQETHKAAENQSHTIAYQVIGNSC